MMKSDLTNMTIAQLRHYVLEHNDDQQAFYLLIDRLKNKTSAQNFPCPNTPENIKIMKQAIQEKFTK
ncbi:MAG: hypothetical protein PT120_01670 [Aphanizomenon gracile PMC649.10]|nr:hypothetical protein [Aphanizomenon gracile PMC649.10]